MANAGNTSLIHTGRDTFTDQGVHRFDFALLFGDRLAPEALDAAARRLALPPIHFDRYEGLARPLPPAANPTPPNSMVTQATIEATRSALGVAPVRNTQ
jgi:hypothetical protein